MQAPPTTQYFLEFSGRVAYMETHLTLLHWLSHLVCVVLILKTHTILPNLKITEGSKLLLSDIKFTITSSFNVQFKKINVCSKVFVEYKICFGEFKEGSSSSSLTGTTHPWGIS